MRAFWNALRLPRVMWGSVLLMGLLAIAFFPGGIGLLSFLASVFFLVVLPGAYFAQKILRLPDQSPALGFTWSAGLGVSLIAILYSVAPLFDLNLSRGFWWAYALLAAGGWVVHLFERRQQLVAWFREAWRPSGWPAVLLLGVMAAALAKLVAVMGVPTPPLHDPASHALMAKLVVDNGYAPWYQLPFRTMPFYYPPGLASLVAASHALSGVGVPSLVMYWTNLGTIFAGLAAYALVAHVTANRGAGVFAFGFVAFLSVMPSAEFFLAGKNSSVVSNFVFLAVLLAMLKVRERPSASYAVLTAFLLAACFLLHYEKIYFFIVFLVAFVLGSLVRWREIAWGRLVLAGLGAGFMSLLLVSPWLYRLAWATEQSERMGAVLVPAPPSPYLGTTFRPEALWQALQSIWPQIQQYSEPTLVWLALLSLLTLAVSLKALDLMIFMLGIALFHPAVLEPLGVSMATLSYDRIAIHFAYLPVCLLAAVGLWGIWLLASKPLPFAVRTVVRRALLLLASGAFLYGIADQGVRYAQVARGHALDAHDLEAFAWISENLRDDRPFIVPIPEGNAEMGHYFIQKAGLYLPVYTGHDVAGHFFRIESPQIRQEYQRYVAMLEAPTVDAWAARHRFYTRDDDPYYESLNQWLAKQPEGTLHERYRNARVRILEVRPTALAIK